MTLIRRKAPVRSGIRRGPQREFPSHRQWIRGRECAFARLGDCPGPIECAHYDGPDIPNEEKKGMRIKAHDKWTFPACTLRHHLELGDPGPKAFERKYGVNLKQIAESYAAASPHRFKWNGE
jgi:hypothetical protein